MKDIIKNWILDFIDAEHIQLHTKQLIEEERAFTDKKIADLEERLGKLIAFKNQITN